MCKVCKQKSKLKEIGSLNNKTISYCSHCNSIFEKSQDKEEIIVSDKIIKCEKTRYKTISIYSVLSILIIGCSITFLYGDIFFKKCIWLLIPLIFLIRSISEYINNNYAFWR